MGISGLIPFLKNATRDVHIREFKGWLSLKFQVTYHKMRIQGAPPPRVGFYEGEAGAQESFLRSEPVGFRGSAPPVSEMFGFQWVVWLKRVLKKIQVRPLDKFLNMHLPTYKKGGCPSHIGSLKPVFRSIFWKISSFIYCRYMYIFVHIIFFYTFTIYIDLFF